MSAEPDEEKLRKELQKHFDMPADGLRIDIGPPLLGVYVFHAYNLGSAQGGVTGTFDGHVHTDFDESLRLVLEALKFDDREVDPVVVAAAVGKLEGNPGTPFLNGYSRQGPGGTGAIELPRWVEVDGRPAVEYWNMTSRRPPWRSRVLKLADGTFSVLQDLPES